MKNIISKVHEIFQELPITKKNKKKVFLFEDTQEESKEESKEELTITTESDSDIESKISKEPKSAQPKTTNQKILGSKEPEIKPKSKKKESEIKSNNPTIPRFFDVKKEPTKYHKRKNLNHFSISMDLTKLPKPSKLKRHNTNIRRFLDVKKEPRKSHQRKNLNLLSISMDLTKKDETEEVAQKLTFIKREYQNTKNITHLIKQPIKIDGQFYEKSEIENTSDTKIDTDFYNKTLKWALKRIKECFDFLKEKEEKIPSLKKIEILKFALGLTTDLYDPKPEDKSNDSQLILKRKQILKQLCENFKSQNDKIEESRHKLLLAKLYKDEKKTDKDEKKTDKDEKKIDKDEKKSFKVFNLFKYAFENVESLNEKIEALENMIEITNDKEQKATYLLSLIHLYFDTQPQKSKESLQHPIFKGDENNPKFEEDENIKKDLRYQYLILLRNYNKSYEDEKTSKESFIKLNEWCRINYPAKYQDLNPKPKPSQQKIKISKNLRFLETKIQKIEITPKIYSNSVNSSQLKLIEFFDKIPQILSPKNNLENLYNSSQIHFDEIIQFEKPKSSLSKSSLLSKSLSKSLLLSLSFSKSLLSKRERETKIFKKEIQKFWKKMEDTAQYDELHKNFTTLRYVTNLEEIHTKLNKLEKLYLYLKDPKKNLKIEQIRELVNFIYQEIGEISIKFKQFHQISKPTNLIEYNEQKNSKRQFIQIQIIRRFINSINLLKKLEKLNSEDPDQLKKFLSNKKFHKIIRDHISEMNQINKYSDWEDFILFSLFYKYKELTENEKNQETKLSTRIKELGNENYQLFMKQIKKKLKIEYTKYNEEI
ncbi:hypothetical protein M0811_10298 [Anaeramoeba ignava]|uniref:Uncharacterized protein n=1 Tax=Anaeramoeba ignava TaxID=1746090 RepID=A0A9Q0LFF4_ANAIG|nr:hypothetical protein M0811_10298 [Anaeramoeba ignava]